MPRKRRKKNRRGRRDWERVRQWTELRTQGFTYALIADYYGVTRQAVWKMVHWDHHMKRLPPIELNDQVDRPAGGNHEA